MTALTITKTAPPEWLLAFWKEIDDKTFGKGFDCFVEDATCRLGVAEWNGREQIRENLLGIVGLLGRLGCDAGCQETEAQRAAEKNDDEVAHGSVSCL